MMMSLKRKWRHLLPLTTALLIVAISVANWALLENWDRRHVHTVIRQNTSAAQHAVRFRLQLALRSLQRFGRRWETLGSLSPEDLQEDAKILVEQSTAVRAILLADGAGAVRLIANDPKQPITLVAGGSAPGAQTPLWQDAVEADQTRLAFTADATGGKSYLTALIPWHKGTTAGLLVGILDQEKPFLEVLQAFSNDGYAGVVSLNGQEFYRFGASAVVAAERSEWGVEQEVAVAGAILGVRLWPTPELLASLQSRLPAVTLLSGLLVAMLVGLAVHVFIDRQRHMIEAMRATEDLNRFFTLSLDLLCIAGTDAYFKRINSAFTETLGYSIDDLLAKPFIDFVHPEDRERTLAAVQTLAQGTAITSFENRYRRKDGMYRWISWRSAPDPERGLIYAAARDVTAEKALGQELREANEHLELRVQERTKSLTETVANLERAIAQRDEFQREMIASERKYRDLIEGAVQGTVVFTEDGTLLFANRAAAAMFGFASPAEMLGTSFIERIAPHERERLLEFRERRLRGEDVPDQYEYQGVKRDGETIWLVDYVQPITWEAQSAWRCTLSDVTRVKAAEKRTRLLEARQSAMLAAIPDMVLVFGRDGRISDFLGRETANLRIPRDELVGRDLREFLPLEQVESYLRKIEETIDSGEVQTYVFEAPVGEETKHFETRLAPFGPDQVLAVVRDVTQRVTLERQFNQSQRMETVGRLAGGVAHDFNNMLAVILSYANFVLEAVSDHDSVREDVQEIIMAANRSAALTGQLLAFSRRQVLKLEDVNVNEVVSGLEKMLRRLIGEDVRLTVRLAPDLGIIRADTSQLEQILMNLAVNARDAMPKGGELRIETADVDLDEEYARGHIEVEPGPYVMLSVSDTGTGMDEATRLRIFEPFFTTKELGKGTGLGLSTVFGIVKQLRGSIWVYSEIDQGTVFKIYLPRVQPATEAKGVVSTAPSYTRGTETVLLVEDEKLVRTAARRILESAGYTVLEAREGTEAIEQAEQHTGGIDLLLTDVVMPGMRGSEVAERVRELYPRIRTLYMTGYTDGTIVQNGALQEGVYLLMKPFTKAAVLRGVREALGEAISGSSRFDSK